MRPNSPPQTTSVSSSRPRALRSLSKPGDRLIDGAGVVLVAVLQVAVLVPAVVAAGSWHSSSTKRTPRSTSRRASRHWRPNDFAWRRVVEAVELLASPSVSPREVHQFGHGRLHAEGQFVVGDGRFELVVVRRCGSSARSIELAQQVELAASAARRWLRAARGRRRAVAVAERASPDTRPAGSRC